MEHLPEDRDLSVSQERMIDWCISCCDGALTDDQRTELRSRIATCIAMALEAEPSDCTAADAAGANGTL